MIVSRDFPTVIFIASASRSGSTLVDLSLASCEGVYSVGEVYHLQGFATRSYERVGFKVREYPLVCTCGDSLERCEFWSSVERRSQLDFKSTQFKSYAGALVRRTVQLAYLVLGPGGVRQLARRSSAVRDELAIAANCDRVYSAVATLTGASYIVDSSKSMYQYILLHSHRSTERKLVCLHRDGRAVSYSMIRGARAKTFEGAQPFDQAVRAWRRWNRLIRWFSHRTPERDKTTLSYEDFCAAPEDEILRMSRELDLGIQEIRANLEGVRHNIGGSPSRFSSDQRIRLDERWKEELSADRAARFERIGGSMNRKLGYR